uniref:alpha-1,2-Mannosidase n=1 Tax=Arcella intermedia TaxID=1963864 RepID=A0A6B2LU27_9EUKA
MVALFALAFISSTQTPHLISFGELSQYKQETKDMFLHAYRSYMKNAFPADELKPISCSARYREGRGTLDDSLGEYSLTLIDSLSSLVVSLE